MHDALFVPRRTADVILNAVATTCTLEVQICRATVTQPSCCRACSLFVNDSGLTSHPVGARSLEREVTIIAESTWGTMIKYEQCITVRIES